MGRLGEMEEGGRWAETGKRGEKGREKKEEECEAGAKEKEKEKKDEYRADLHSNLILGASCTPCCLEELDARHVDLRSL